MVMEGEDHEDGDGEDEPSVFEQACDEFTEMAIEDGTLPDGDDIEENIEWTTAQMEYAHDEEQIHEEIAAEEARFDDMEMAEAQGWNEEDGESSDDGFDPDEENWEAEDMPGDNADEREEAYDNHDWDAADG